MKAAVRTRYCAPEEVEVRELEKPVPAHDEVLVRVRAAGLNILDWYGVTGRPWVSRVSTGLRAPKEHRLGVDYAGTVEAVGRNVTDFESGDEVLGARTGALAEYVVARADRAIVQRPATVPVDEAAAVAVAATTALQGLRDKGGLERGQKVLINGASGGVGTFAVQIAKAFGAEVTGVCSTRNADLVRSIGADHVIDYTREDFTRNGRRYDVVFDLVGNRSLTECRRALTPAGKLILSGGGVSEGGSFIGPIGLIVRAQLLSRFVRQRLITLTAKPSKENLATLRELVEAGKVTPVIDRTYPLDEAAEAIRYVEVDHARAKVVITV
jgi:NADPH:quinone reductase-like Zn-dependent oxidoreductase